jgi:hypothetical protein
MHRRIALRPQCFLDVPLGAVVGMGESGRVGVVCFIAAFEKRDFGAPSARPLPALANQTRSAGETKVNPTDNLRYVWSPPDQFMMGCSPDDSLCGDDEKPAREVRPVAGLDRLNGGDTTRL